MGGHRTHHFFLISRRSTLPMYLWPTRRPLFRKYSAPSAESSQIPSDANFPNTLSFLSHATSSIRKPCPPRSFSSMIFSIVCAFAFSKSKSSIGVRCTTTPNCGFTSFVLFPSSFNHSVLLRAASADAQLLNRMTYPVLVVPILATLASCVDGAFNSAVRMWELAESVGRYWPKLFPSLLSLSLRLTNDL